MTRDKLINWLTRRTADESQLEAADMLQRDGKELERLRAELETERMRLVACSVIAIANTPESAASARGIHPDYQSPSCDDVARAVDREIALRAELAEANGYINRMRDLLTAAYPCIDQSRDACNCILCELVSRERQQAALAGKGG